MKFVAETKKLTNVMFVVDMDLSQVNVIVKVMLKVAIKYVTLDLYMINVMYAAVLVFLMENVIVSVTF